MKRTALATLAIAMIAASILLKALPEPVLLRPEEVFSLRVEGEPSKAAVVPPRLLILCFSDEPSHRSKVLAIDMLEGRSLWNVSLPGIVDKVIPLPGSGTFLLAVTRGFATPKVSVSLYLLSPQGKLTKINETTVILLRREESIGGWNPFYSLSPNGRFLLVEVGHVIAYCIDAASADIVWAHKVKVGGILYGVATNNGGAFLITIDTACYHCIFVEKVKWLKFVNESGDIVSNFERSSVLGGTFVVDENKAVLVSVSGQIVAAKGLGAGEYKESVVLDLGRKIKGLSLLSRFAYGSLPRGRYLYFFAEDIRGPGVFAYDTVTRDYKWVPLTAMNVTARNVKVQGWDDGVLFVLTEATTRPQIVLVDIPTGQQLVLVSSRSHTSPGILSYSIDTKTVVLKVREKTGGWLVKVLRLVRPKAKTHILTITVRGEEGEEPPFMVMVNGTVFYPKGNVTLTLPEGTYEVVVSAEGYVQRKEIVKLTRDLNLSLILQRIAHELLVRVTFSDGGSPEGIVRVVASNGSIVASSPLKRGLAMFTLPKANYTLEVYANETLLASRRVNVTSSGELNIVIPVVTFCFHVRNEGGADIENARVILSDLNGVVRYESSGGPLVKVRAIKGTYLAKIMAEDYMEQEFKVSGAEKGCRLVVLRRKPGVAAGPRKEGRGEPHTYTAFPLLAAIVLVALLLALRRKGISLPRLRGTLSRNKKEVHYKRARTRAHGS